jgi:hypothetical protein
VLWLPFSGAAGAGFRRLPIERLINRRTAPSAGIAVTRGTTGPSLTSIS